MKPQDLLWVLMAYSMWLYAGYKFMTASGTFMIILWWLTFLWLTIKWLKRSGR